jgi:flagellin-like hook-associated protein FlgL
MSGIVLTASVRQNLLSLQSTAELLSTTQNRLASGKKVNTALDNPTNFFTAQGLDNRASDINNLLDSIGNGVQVLQAANTGITSLQKLVDSAKSIASQVLQTTVGYTPRSNVSSSPIAGATPTNLLGTGTNATVTGAAIPGATATTTKLSALTTAITTSDSLTIDGKTISFNTSGGGNAITSAGGSLDLTTATVGDLLAAVDTLTGATVPSTLGGTALTLSTGTTSALTIGGNATTLTKLGLTAGTTQVGAPPLSGQTLTIGATGSNGIATSITFGTGSGQISTLNQLNAALANNNLQAGISPSGVINIVTTNEAASSKIGTIGGTATGAGAAFNGLTNPPAPVADPDSQTARAGLVAQYNNVLNQINTTSEDASFNGINLLNGDTLKLTFNETGKSTLNITGVTFNLAGLSLATLNQGTDFLDSNSANSVLTSLNAASTTLRSEASSLGSNLSIVQIRQDFSKNLINVLQTGSSNLTLADTNEEAANSQALSTRQSIAVSALALSNQSQQSVLQLLR